jgi:predicted acylesterase/phospholipase RssA
LIALAVAITPQNKTLEQLTEFFKDTATSTFSQSMIKKFWSQLGIMLFNITDSIYSAAPLEKATKGLFGRGTSLFAPALTPGHSQISTRVAVTSSIGYADTMTLITNYNHPQGHNETREENDSKDMRVWEAALATSAAPYYLPPFKKTSTGTMYVDGAVFANCPAATAYAETKALWPNRAASLDLLVSLGTGRQQAKHAYGGGLQKFIPNGIIRTFANMLMHQSNSDESWHNFARSVPSAVKAKLHRLDPPLDVAGDRIGLDDYAKMDDITATVNSWIESPEGSAMIKRTAYRLLASLFFFEPDDYPSPSSPSPLHTLDHTNSLNNNTPTSPSSTSTSSSSIHRLPPGTQVLSGWIRCRLPRNSSGLRRLLTQKAESLVSTVIPQGRGGHGGSDYNDVHENVVCYWDPIMDPRTGCEYRLAECVDQSDDTGGQCHVNVAYTFRDEVGSQSLHVVGVKFRGVEGPVPISGFPVTMAALVGRAGLRWLQ